MKKLLVIISFIIISSSIYSQTLKNGDFTEGKSHWGCNPEVHTENVYGGFSSINKVAEIDTKAKLCQNITDLEIGQAYTFSIKVSRRTGRCPGPDPASININIDGGVLNESITRNGSFDLIQFDFSFTATKLVHMLNITPEFGGTTCGVIVDDIEVFSISPLALSNINLIGELRNNQTTLSWFVEIENQYKSFVVERSFDKNEWQTLNTITTNTENRNGFKFSQKDEKPLIGRSYYRVKLIDKSGIVSTTNLITIENLNGNFISAYPNPTKDFVTVTVSEDISYSTIEVFDSYGKKVSEINPDTIHQRKQIDLRNLKKGIYLISVNTDNETKLLRIIKSD